MARSARRGQGGPLLRTVSCRFTSPMPTVQRWIVYVEDGPPVVFPFYWGNGVPLRAFVELLDVLSVLEGKGRILAPADEPGLDLAVRPIALDDDGWGTATLLYEAEEGP